MVAELGRLAWRAKLGLGLSAFHTCDIVPRLAFGRLNELYLSHRISGRSQRDLVKTDLSTPVLENCRAGLRRVRILAEIAGS